MVILFFFLDAIWKTKIGRMLTTEMLKYENPGWETVNSGQSYLLNYKVYDAYTVV